MMYHVENESFHVGKKTMQGGVVDLTSCEFSIYFLSIFLFQFLDNLFFDYFMINRDNYITLKSHIPLDIEHKWCNVLEIKFMDLITHQVDIQSKQNCEHEMSSTNIFMLNI